MVLAGTWWDFGDGDAPKGFRPANGRVWALDASYASVPTASRCNTRTPNSPRRYPAKMSSDFDGWNVSLGYSIAPGLKWYGEVTRGSFRCDGHRRTEGRRRDIPGRVFLSGLYLNF